jgi:glycosyltransferase 2 family protein
MSERDHHDRHYELVKRLRPVRVLLPVIIGLAVVTWLMTRELNMKTLREITFTWNSVFWLTAALMLVGMMAYWYMVRIKGLCDNEISWRQAFRIIILWEFTSAVTPSTVGGTAFAIVFIHKEGISVGRSTSIVLLTSFLDEMYFVVMFPLLVLLVGAKEVFITPPDIAYASIMNNLVVVALSGYFIILLWVLIVGYGLFFKPEAIRRLIIGIFSLPFLRRWKDAAIRSGDDIVMSSGELKRKSGPFWRKAILSTFLTWTSRYLVMNAILLAFFSVSDHLVIFTKQLILWVMMLVSPSPGGAGFAEIILGRYMTEYIPVDSDHALGVSLAMAVIWRAVIYYPFLLAGVFVVPAWITRKFKRPLKQ